MCQADAQRGLGFVIGIICTSVFWIVFIHYLNRLHYKRKAEVEDLESQVKERDTQIGSQAEEIRTGIQRVESKQRDMNLFSETISELRNEISGFQGNAADRQTAIRQELETAHGEELSNVREELRGSVQRERETSSELEGLKKVTAVLRQRFERTNQDFSTILEQLAETEKRAEQLEIDLSVVRGVHQDIVTPDEDEGEGVRTPVSEKEDSDASLSSDVIETSIGESFEELTKPLQP